MCRIGEAVFFLFVFVVRYLLAIAVPTLLLRCQKKRMGEITHFSEIYSNCFSLNYKKKSMRGQNWGDISMWSVICPACFFQLLCIVGIRKQPVFGWLEKNSEQFLAGRQVSRESQGWDVLWCAIVYNNCQALFRKVSVRSLNFLKLTTL